MDRAVRCGASVIAMLLCHNLSLRRCRPFLPVLPCNTRAHTHTHTRTHAHTHIHTHTHTHTHTRAHTHTSRYLFNDTHWGGKGSPIIFYTGAEGTGVQDIWTHSGWIADTLARELKAMVVFAELRFFGESMPFGPSDSFLPRPDRIGLLSIEQVSLLGAVLWRLCCWRCAWVLVQQIVWQSVPSNLRGLC
jgi:hypothetical protein